MKDRLTGIILKDDHFDTTDINILLDKYAPEIDLIAKTTNSSDFLDLIFRKKPDLLFLDINLNQEKNTLEVLSVMEDLDCEIVILNSDEFYAVKAINQYKVTGYIVKPIKVAQFKRVISNVIKKINSKKSKNSAPVGLLEKIIPRFIRLNSLY